jgi:hypothetical protein
VQTTQVEGEISYIHKSIYEFFIAQSIIEETLNKKFQPVDEEKTVLKLAYLADDLDVLVMVAEHVLEMPITLQYYLCYEVWYRSLLLTRKIKEAKKAEVDKEKREELEKIGSNSMNLLAGPAHCDLTNRDFSGCAMPRSYLYKRDISGSKRERKSIFIVTNYSKLLFTYLFSKRRFH